MLKTLRGIGQDLKTGLRWAECFSKPSARKWTLLAFSVLTALIGITCVGPVVYIKHRANNNEALDPLEQSYQVTQSIWLCAFAGGLGMVTGGTGGIASISKQPKTWLIQHTGLGSITVLTDISIGISMMVKVSEAIDNRRKTTPAPAHISDGSATVTVASQNTTQANTTATSLATLLEHTVWNVQMYIFVPAFFLWISAVLQIISVMITLINTTDIPDVTPPKPPENSAVPQNCPPSNYQQPPFPPPPAYTVGNFYNDYGSYVPFTNTMFAPQCPTCTCSYCTGQPVVSYYEDTACPCCVCACTQGCCSGEQVNNGFPLPQLVDVHTFNPSHVNDFMSNVPQSTMRPTGLPDNLTCQQDQYMPVPTDQDEYFQPLSSWQLTGQHHHVPTSPLYSLPQSQADGVSRPNISPIGSLAEPANKEPQLPWRSHRDAPYRRPQKPSMKEDLSRKQHQKPSQGSEADSRQKKHMMSSIAEEIRTKRPNISWEHEDAYYKRPVKKRATELADWNTGDDEVEPTPSVDYSVSSKDEYFVSYRKRPTLKAKRSPKPYKVYGYY